MKIQTTRFGELEVGQGEVIAFPEGILGFQDDHRYCLVDAGDDTLILWLQSIDHPNIAFPVLEPKIFQPNYVVKLSPAELRVLKVDSVSQGVVFSILTIPGNVYEMTANLKAPIVINMKDQVGRQVVLQENDYQVRHPMFKELRMHLSARPISTDQVNAKKQSAMIIPINLRQIP